jgi:hypothetical protein
MTDVISEFNFTWSYGQNHRQFKIFLNKVKSKYGAILYYSEV